ncbi:MAG TPA: hypothetical protein VMV54_09470 [Acidocella sp.]|nr:hypothetical protein [Acidocella sp.]
MIRHIGFSPALPWPVLAALAVLVIAICLLPPITKIRGSVLRLSGFLLLLAVLSGPAWTADTVTPLPDIALLLIDHSQSMDIGSRNTMAARAVAALRASAGSTQLDIVDIPPTDTGGTSLAPGLHDALATIPPDQLAGIIAVTDGQISGAITLPHHVPFTALLTAKGEETDRELRLNDAPSFGLVGQNQKLRLTVIDHGVNDSGATASVSVSEDGTQVASQQAVIGQPLTINLPVRHAGPIVITAAVTPLPSEVSQINDQAAFTLTGIHKRLNVLLISGSPDQGERAWRLLLKSDPAVQLVHFTILRTPGEPIGADPQDIALVPFPVRELFETDIGKFDLIILDGFNADGLLPSEYLANIATFVEHGGALLTEVGPEFSGPDSLAFSPLSPVLPAMPASPGTVTKMFSPVVTPLGARHPVTAPFADINLPPWYRMEAATTKTGDVLMTGANSLPLLILAKAGKGRSGILLSDQLWLWTRGGSHEGPALPLLRRIVHFLLREPALEPESLTAGITNQTLSIDRQTLSPTYPGDATLTSPDGTTKNLALKQTAPGHFTASLTVNSATGVWRINEGGLTAYAANSNGNSKEYEDLAATSANLRGIAHNIIWLGNNPAPQLGPLLMHRHAVQVTGTRTLPLLPPLPTLAIALALIIAAWWRESGTRQKPTLG